MTTITRLKIIVTDGIPQIPEECYCLDVTGAVENSIFNDQKYYTRGYQIHPDFPFYMTRNDLIVQFARDRVADQRIQFIYKILEGKWLFVTSTQTSLCFIF